MTKSAKQDTTKAPADPTETGTVETESAATQATEARATEARATEARADQHPEAGPTAKQEDGAADEAADGEAKPDLDETKRKFREALERKQQAQSDSQGDNGRDGSKINSAHGPAASRRSFRRKSG
jgi:Family of unknown function (DUF5302)